MKKYFTCILLLIGYIAAYGQVTTQSISAADLPNLIPGYSQVTTINTKTITCTPSVLPTDPRPLTGNYDGAWG